MQPLTHDEISSSTTTSFSQATTTTTTTQETTTTTTTTTTSSAAGPLSTKRIDLCSEQKDCVSCSKMPFPCFWCKSQSVCTQDPLAIRCNKIDWIHQGGVSECYTEETSAQALSNVFIVIGGLGIVLIIMFTIKKLRQ